MSFDHLCYRPSLALITHHSSLITSSMPYILNTAADQQAMLAAIGAKSLDELFEMVPAELRLKRPLDLPPALTEIGADRAPEPAGREECFGRPAGLLPGGRQLRPFHSGRRRRDRLARRVLHVVHALSARGEPGQPAGVLRIPDHDHPADGHGSFERQPVRRRQRGGRSRADEHRSHRASGPRGHGRQRSSRVSPDPGHLLARSRMSNWSRSARPAARSRRRSWPQP